MEKDELEKEKIIISDDEIKFYENECKNNKKNI